jgi:glycosyltransferase involved in cell wall biosynthesis
MQFNIAMTVFNRSEVLKRSLNSLSETKTDYLHNLYVFDDNSTDPEVELILKEFVENTRNKFSVHIFRNESNLGCDKNMCQVINHTFKESGQDFIITTDSDVIYNQNWLNFMQQCKEEMITNKNIAAISLYDSIVHNPTESYNDIFNVKSSIGGLCALLNKEVFCNIKTIESWDWEFVRVAKEMKMLLLCVKKSFIQHIGQYGTHSPDGSLYDFSATFVD